MEGGHEAGQQNEMCVPSF